MALDDESPIRAFRSALAWEKWLARNFLVECGIWIRFAKKTSGIATVTYAEAVDVALCYGWIDGQRKSHGELHFIQRFTPRRPRSLWSKRNVANVARLIDASRMQPGGMAEVEAAQRDGRWQAAYDSQKDMTVPADFLLAVEHNQKVNAFFQTLGKASRYAIALKLHNARTAETRARRFGALLEMLGRGEIPR